MRGGVRVFRLDRQQALEALRRWAESLPAGVLAVVLFGSLARGDQNAFSDADVLIVLTQSDKPFADRIPDYLPAGIGIPVDVFPYTVDELRLAGREGTGVVSTALAEGLFLRGDRNQLPL